MSEFEIEYREGNDLEIGSVVELYRRSKLGLRRPIGDLEVMEQMIRNANLIITAWDKQRLVGISRSLTDYGYITYLADLAVDEEYQKMGIGIRLIEETRIRIGPKCKITLLAAPDAVGYYPHIGFRQHPSAWMLDAESPLGTNGQR